nr:hypothetical protein Iba_chr13dCG4440 [Ipomoea batatas]
MELRPWLAAMTQTTVAEERDCIGLPITLSRSASRVVSSPVSNVDWQSMAAVVNVNGLIFSVRCASSVAAKKRKMARLLLLVDDGKLVGGLQRHSLHLVIGPRTSNSDGYGETWQGKAFGVGGVGKLLFFSLFPANKVWQRWAPGVTIY